MNTIMDDLQEFFEGNPIFNLLSLLLAVVGIFFTFYFYFKSRRAKTPTYLIRTINLVRESIKKIDTVDILFSGKKIENLSLAKIALWNDGKDTISHNDVAKSDPVRIVIRGGFEILDAEVVYQKNLANDFRINLASDNKSLVVSFDYFDFEEGAIIQIAHTGNSSEDIEIMGQIKSVKKIYRREILTSIIPNIILKVLKNNSGKIKRRNGLKVAGLITLFMGLFVMTLPLFVTKSAEVSNEPSMFTRVFSIVLGLLYMWSGYNILKRRIPKGFDIFNEEF